jgi:hypothetical protein
MAEGPVQTAVQSAWKKLQSGVYKGIDVSVPEVKMLDNVRDFDAPYSFKENRIVVDLNRDGGIATIGEGDYEARERLGRARGGLRRPLALQRSIHASRT